MLYCNTALYILQLYSALHSTALYNPPQTQGVPQGRKSGVHTQKHVPENPCISSLGSSERGLIPCIIFADAPQLPSKIFHFTRTRRFARAFDRCHGGHRARPAPPRAFGLKKHTSRPLVSRAGTRRASLRLRRLCARCARALVPHQRARSAAPDKVERQESVGSDALAAFVVPLDAFESRGKDDCLRAPPSCARVSIQLGSSKVCRVVHDQRDFLECHTTDHLTKDRSMHLEGKTNGDARGREIATCAAVGAEIRTCIRRLVRVWPLKPTRGRGTAFLRDRRDFSEDRREVTR